MARRIVLYFSRDRRFYVSDFYPSIMASSFRKFSETWHGSGPITEFEPEWILYARSLKQMRPAIELNDIIYRGFVTSINLWYISFPIIFFMKELHSTELNLTIENVVSIHVYRKTFSKNSNCWSTIDNVAYYLDKNTDFQRAIKKGGIKFVCKN